DELQAKSQEPASGAAPNFDLSADAMAAGDVAVPNPETEGALAVDPDVATFMREHAPEIAAEEGKPFQAIGGISDELRESAATAEIPVSPVTASLAESSHAHAQACAPAKTAPAVQRRGSALQKIASLDVKGRIQLAMKGTKEERSILIRDGTKIVALAVLDSAKITDAEVERFASQKNVLEAVLRGILMKRRFAKNYTIMRNLVCNPRTPVDVSLGLMKNLLVGD